MTQEGKYRAGTMGAVLPDHEIRFFSDFPVPLVEPYNEDQLAPSSYDCRLASVVKVRERWHPNRSCLHDLRKPIENTLRSVDIAESGWILHTGGFILASTQEKINLPKTIVGRVEGKSSIARLGIQIHSAGYLDPGFRGNVTLEIAHFGPDPVHIWPDILIAQLSFEYLASPCESPYNGRYQDSEGVVGSRFNDPDRQQGGRSASLDIEQAAQNA